jgi:hypothetical protein
MVYPLAPSLSASWVFVEKSSSPSGVNRSASPARFLVFHARKKSRTVCRICLEEHAVASTGLLADGDGDREVGREQDEVQLPHARLTTTAAANATRRMRSMYEAHGRRRGAAPHS